MGRPKGGKNRKYSYEFKLKAVQDLFDRHLSLNEVCLKHDISMGTLQVWQRLYKEGSLKEGRVRNRGNKFSALHLSEHLTKEQRLELENLKLRIENERLKKGYQVKGGGVNKEYVTLNDVNMKSLDH
ncbi:MAG: transposase [Erysipelotrichaceae bacterium]|nr:transposase [Erysipelotrichaceae bacterium]